MSSNGTGRTCTRSNDTRRARRRRTGRGRAFVAAAGFLALALQACGDDKPAGENSAPRLQGVVAIPPRVTRGGLVQLTALAGDADNDPLTYVWRASGGTLGPATADGRNRWTAPQTSGPYRIDVSVSDGLAADSGFVTVEVGLAALRVESDPAGASILLNGSFLGDVTPHDYVLVPTEYFVRLVSPDFVFAPADTLMDLREGQSAVASFRLPPVGTEYVDTGPTPVDEIGGLTYSRNGLGLIYGARGGTSGTIRSASLVPTHTGTNGAVIQSGVNWEESLSLRTVAGVDELAFVQSDSVTVGRIIDVNFDGLIERMDPPRRFPGLVIRTYAPAFNPEGDRLAFSTQPSTQPNGRDTMLVANYNGVRLTNSSLLSAGNGNAPSLGPQGVAVYESSGEIYSVSLPAPTPLNGTRLTNTGGRVRAPALSPNGRLVAWLDSRGWLMLTTFDGQHTARLLEGISSTRVAWNPQGTELVVADNGQAGNARLRLVTDLPIPQ